MNIKAIYIAAGGIAIAAAAVFFFLGMNNPTSSTAPTIGEQQTNTHNNNNGSSSSSNNNSSRSQPTIMAPIIGVKNISVTKADPKLANVQITFTMKNPNTSTLILETIHYNINVDGKRMTIGDVGASAQGFLDSQGNLFPIVGGTTLTVKDTQTVERNSAIASAWDKMVTNNTKFSIDGTYGYRLTAADLQTTAADKDFKLTFP